MRADWRFSCCQSTCWSTCRRWRVMLLRQQGSMTNPAGRQISARLNCLMGRTWLLGWKLRPSLNPARCGPLASGTLLGATMWLLPTGRVPKPTPYTLVHPAYSEGVNWWIASRYVVRCSTCTWVQGSRFRPVVAESMKDSTYIYFVSNE